MSPVKMHRHYCRGETRWRYVIPNDPLRGSVDLHAEESQPELAALAVMVGGNDTKCVDLRDGIRSVERCVPGIWGFVGAHDLGRPRRRWEALETLRLGLGNYKHNPKRMPSATEIRQAWLALTPSLMAACDRTVA